jgi:hypothetical protein
VFAVGSHGDAILARTGVSARLFFPGPETAGEPLPRSAASPALTWKESQPSISGRKRSRLPKTDHFRGTGVLAVCGDGVLAPFKRDKETDA